MYKRQLIEGPSCLTRAADDEPLFVLRANDPLAAELVMEWANRYIDDKGGMLRMTGEQYDKYHEAAGIARDMREWRMAQPVPAAIADALASAAQDAGHD